MNDLKWIPKRNTYLWLVSLAYVHVADDTWHEWRWLRPFAGRRRDSAPNDTRSIKTNCRWRQFQTKHAKRSPTLHLLFRSSQRKPENGGGGQEAGGRWPCIRMEPLLLVEEISKNHPAYDHSVELHSMRSLWVLTKVVVNLIKCNQSALIFL